ncbi:PREDICTED: uncharacterized protein LOC106107091 [Papilio polytes]|uniref:uncharacterized protein LOC106107091 n=1 Tax=Papilio polytes TaxID=76194 RepID=UPI000675C9CA|nr:PREDICTED: uncharacterized protein LOC106107091 [Papilio polytes]
MGMFRYQYICLLLPLLTNGTQDQHKSVPSGDTNSCPFKRIIEDIFRIQRKYTENPLTIKENERRKFLVNSVTNLTTYNSTHVSIQEELINDIIASINRIKNNMSSEINANETKLNEAIILNVPQNELSNTKANENYNKTGYNTTFIKSGIEDKFDMHPLINATNKYNINKTNISTSKPDYVEILTIEPNTSNNTTQHNIIEVLKHLMPMLNSSNNKELHSVTIIERNHSKNHSISETKNISTLVLKYCDKSNMTAVTDEKLTDDDSGVDYSNKELPVIDQDNLEDDYDIDKENSEYNDKPVASNLTNKNRDVLEAAEYGIQKMHELYSVLEPKLYSMGLWLDDTNPARYLAAFNAPSEDSAKYTRYGYATLQAATKFKQLNRGDADGDGEDAGAESRTEAGTFPAASALRQSALLDQCPLRTAPKCPPASKR